MRFKFLSAFYGLNSDLGYIWQKSPIKTVDQLTKPDILAQGEFFKLKKNEKVSKKHFYLTSNFLYYTNVQKILLKKR